MKPKKYCVFCGTENEDNVLNCKKCHKKLDPEEHPFLDYMKSKIKNKFQGEVEDNVKSILIHFIKSHLYGFIMTCSILITSTCVVVNTVKSNHEEIEMVTEKPTVVTKQISYAGTGLSALEVAEKYIDAIKKNDLDTVKALRLETFYKDIYNTVITEKAEFYTDGPATNYDLWNYRDIYFKNVQGDIYIGGAETVRDIKIFQGYTSYNFLVSLHYCSYNNCSTKTSNGFGFDDFYAHDEIQIVQVEDHYYVLGEMHALRMGENEVIGLRSLFLAKGDTTSLSFEKELNKYDACNLNEECIKSLGYDNLD